MKKNYIIYILMAFFIVAGAGCDNKQVDTKVVNDNPIEDQASNSTGTVPVVNKPVLLYVETADSVPVDWLTYKNEKYGFEFQYPSEAEVSESTDGDGVVSMKFASANEPDHGFSAVTSKTLDVWVNKAGADGLNCEMSQGYYLNKKLIKIGDNNFCLTQFDDGTAGTMYHTYSYQTLKKDLLISFNFVIPEVSCGAYGRGDGCVPMDEEQEMEMLKQIVSTYKDLDLDNQSLKYPDSIELIEREITADKPGYSIEIKYPYFATDKQGYNKLNNIIETFVKDESEWFENDAINMDSEHDVGKWFMEYGYVVTAIDEDYVSLLFRGSVYSGGAHPGPLYKTIIFDLKENQEIGLKKLFKDDFNYLDYLSLESRKKLPAAEDFSDDDWINDGTLPLEENFELAYLDGSKLKIIFPPYQVAPYAAGSQEISFSTDELKNYLSDKWLNRLTQD